MLFYSALGFVLLLASSVSSQEVNPAADKILEDISTAVANDMAQVAKAAIASHVTTLDMYTKLLDSMRKELKRLDPRLQELFAISGGSPELAKFLALKINQNKALKEALAAGEELATPRFVGALAIGITQIAADVVNMGLRRY